MDADSEEEWFLESIKRYRYKQLIMFDTGDPILQIELCDTETICLLCERELGQKTIPILTLPTRMTQTYYIQQSNDLKIKTGILPSSSTCRIMAIYGENRLLRTQNDVCGLMVHNIKHFDTDEITYGTKTNFSLLNPEITLVDKSTVVLTKDTLQKTIIGDLNNGEVLKDFVVGGKSNSILVPVCLNENIIAFSEKNNGTTHLYDWKSNEMVGKINAGEESDAAMFPASNYSYIRRMNCSNNLYFLSQSGIFKIYDMRNITKPFMRHNLKLSTIKEYLKMQFKPENSNIVSISGFDQNVYIFDVSKNMKEVFKHDGHSRTEDCEKNTLVTDHLWYGNDFIISGALNNSINCWIPDHIDE